MKHPRTHRTLSGIDIAAPGGLDALFAHHRALFGDATMSANAGDAGAGSGGAGGGAGGGTGDAGAGGGGDAGAGAGDKGGDGGKAPAGTDWDGKVESLPEPVQKLIRELRTENGDRRTKLTAAETKQQEIVRAFAKAAGIDLPGDDDQQPDPAKLTEQLTATQAQARRASVELAVYRAAGTHQGDPNALLDSNAFLAKVTDLDPAAADFQSKVDDAIKTAVAANPKLKAQAAGKSSVDHSAGGSGEGRNRTPRPLTDAVAGHYGTA